MVDWSKGGCASIYVNSARQTLTAANKILKYAKFDKINKMNIAKSQLEK